MHVLWLQEGPTQAVGLPLKWNSNVSADSGELLLHSIVPLSKVSAWQVSSDNLSQNRLGNLVTNLVWTIWNHILNIGWTIQNGMPNLGETIPNSRLTKC